MTLTCFLSEITTASVSLSPSMYGISSPVSGSTDDTDLAFCRRSQLHPSPSHRPCVASPLRSVALQMTLTWLFVGDHNCIRLLLSIGISTLISGSTDDTDLAFYRRSQLHPFPSLRPCVASPLCLVATQMTLTWLFVGDHNCIRLPLSNHPCMASPHRSVALQMTLTCFLLKITTASVSFSLSM